MLVLSRKLGESIEIGDRRVVVTVVGLRQSRVQLGIDAPPDVAVHRSEKADQYANERSESTGRVSIDSPNRGVGKGGVDSQSVDSQSVDSQSVDSQSVDSQSVDCQSVDCQSVDSQSVDSANGRDSRRITGARRSSGGPRSKKATDSSGATDFVAARDPIQPSEETFSDSLLEDLARVQAEIAVLAELVSPGDQLVARQVAAEALERLASINRALRLHRPQRAERPIAAYLNSRSRELSKTGANSSNRPETQRQKNVSSQRATQVQRNHMPPVSSTSRSADSSLSRGEPSERSEENHDWHDCGDSSSTMIRETRATFPISTATCSLS